MVGEAVIGRRERGLAGLRVVERLPDLFREQAEFPHAGQVPDHVPDGAGGPREPREREGGGLDPGRLDPRPRDEAGQVRGQDLAEAGEGLVGPSKNAGNQGPVLEDAGDLGDRTQVREDPGHPHVGHRVEEALVEDAHIDPEDARLVQREPLLLQEHEPLEDGRIRPAKGR